MLKLATYVSLAVMALPVSVGATEPATAQAAKAKYSTADTDIGTLLDDPLAKAIIEKYIPGMTTNDQIEMARSMTLKAIQNYAPEDVTDARLTQIDAEFAKLK